MNIHDAVHRVDDAKGLAGYIDRLRRDPEIADGVLSAAQFLEQMSAFLRDTSEPGGYLDRYRNVQSKGGKLSADLLLSATTCEQCGPPDWCAYSARGQGQEHVEAGAAPGGVGNTGVPERGLPVLVPPGRAAPR